MTEGVRLQKVLAERGVAARRKAERLIAQGRVRVDGRVVRELGTRVDPGARIEVDGARVAAAPRHRYVALHKPAGVLSSARAERGRRSVADLVGLPERLYPVGRLDADSEGLILLTNDGAWAERVLHPRYGHEREYEVTVEGDLTGHAVDRLRSGVRLEEGLARAERVDLVSRDRRGGRLRVVLRTGWKRQIRRMCAAVGSRVTRLIRVRIGPIHLGRLAPGQWRELTSIEVQRAAASDAGSRRSPKQLAVGGAGSGDGARARPEQRGPRRYAQRAKGSGRGSAREGRGSAPPPTRDRTRGELRETRSRREPLRTR